MSKVIIKNLKEECVRTIAYADEIEIEVILEPDQQKELQDFLRNMPPGSQVPIKVNFPFPGGTQLLLNDAIQVRGKVNKRSWWNKFLK